MLTDIISSKTRIKLLLKFFLNSNMQSHLRGLAEEFNESTHAVRLELNRLEKAGMFVAHPSGNKKVFRANVDYLMFKEVQNIVRKYLGIDKLVLYVID